MPHSLSMPTELLVEIFGYLHPDTGLDSRASASTLNALTQTCRLLHPIATQTLYERYHPLFHAPCQKYMWRLASDPLVRSCIKHIKVESGELDDVDEWRPASEIRANFEQLGALQQYEFANDTLEKELTLLVLQAPNLESYIHHTLEECIDPVVTKVTPSWLRPFLDIGRQVHQGILPIQKYRNLHTVKINTQLMFDTELAYLFALPSLRRLRIILASCKGQDEAALRWPIAIAGTSGVHTLQLDEISLPADVVAQMIMCCRKLVVFECFGVSNEFEDPSSWCQKVVSALEYHGGSLTRLCLDPQPRAFMKNTGEDYKRVDGFHLLTALESLWTPFHILMGRPVGATDDARFATTTSPFIEVVSPSETTSPHSSNEIESVLSSAGLITANESTKLQKFRLEYGAVKWDEPFTLDLEKVCRFYRGAGVDFEYKIKSNIHVLSGEGTSTHEKHVTLARELARYGTNRLEMARHFEFWDEDLTNMVEDLLKQAVCHAEVD